MDYFEPIFRELEPPELLYMPHEALSIDPKTYDNFCEEFEALASVNFYNSWNEYFENNAIPRNEYRSIMQHRKDTFVYMKILGVEEVYYISNLLIDEPVHADYLLAAYEYLIEPIFDLLKASKNFCLSEIQYYDLNSLAQKMPPPPQQSQGLHSFPIEIGRYIMKKSLYIHQLIMVASKLFNTISKMNCTKSLKPLIKQSKLKSKTGLLLTYLN
jgi:hypothetical protein